MQSVAASISVPARVRARLSAPRARGASAPRASVRAAASNTENPRFALLFDCDGVIVETGARRERRPSRRARAFPISRSFARRAPKTRLASRARPPADRPYPHATRDAPPGAPRSLPIRPRDAEELHRRAYNASFQHFKLAIDGAQVDWSVEYYDILANTVGGGKPKMKYHFRRERLAHHPEFFGGAVPSTEDEQNALVDALQDKKTEFYKEIVETTATARPGVLRLMDEAIADPSIAVGICSAATKAGSRRWSTPSSGPSAWVRWTSSWRATT